ncbi:hypothetical protein JCM11754A_11900 [Isoptericola variabilis]
MGGGRDAERRAGDEELAHTTDDHGHPRTLPCPRRRSGGAPAPGRRRKGWWVPRHAWRDAARRTVVGYGGRHDTGCVPSGHGITAWPAGAEITPVEPDLARTSEGMST